MLPSICTDHLSAVLRLLDCLTLLLKVLVLVLQKTVCSDEHVQFVLQKLSLFITFHSINTLLVFLFSIVEKVLQLIQLAVILPLHGTSLSENFAALVVNLRLLLADTD